MADELQAFCLLLLDIKIVKKEEVSLFIYLFLLYLCSFFLFYRMVRRNPGTSCELMTGKNIHNCLWKWPVIIFSV